MEKLTGENLGEATQIRKIAFASFIGTAIEAYDLYIYGTAAALVFAALFFPEFSPIAGTLAAFGTFGVSFFARPLGAAIFGHYGDKVGRKSMLVISLLVMGLATFLVGLLPGYAAIGIAAPLLLVILRFLQGIGFGGEWGGAVLMSAEHAPSNKRGFYTSFTQIGGSIGFLCSSGVFLLLTTMLVEEQFDSWGWRVPFLLSIVLVGVGLYVRATIAETPAFQRVAETESEARAPIVEVFRAYPRVLALATCAPVLAFVVQYLLTTFMLFYGTEELGVARGTLLYCQMLAIALQAVGIVFFNALSDRYGRRNVILGGAAVGALWAFPLFWLTNTANPVLIAVAFSVFALVFAMVYGPMGAFLSELFGARVRYSGTSVSFNLGGILGGAFAPIIATQLLASTGGAWSISLYIAVVALVTFVCVLLLPETHGTDYS